VAIGAFSSRHLRLFLYLLGGHIELRIAGGLHFRFIRMAVQAAVLSVCGMVVGRDKDKDYELGKENGDGKGF